MLPAGFHPLVARWFDESIGRPTEVQARAWPAIAAGDHVLVTAPTGSGKTLTAFLWALNQLIAGVWPLGETSVLYVSPLKALNNDIQRNLLSPLAGLRARFAAAGEPMPEIRVLTRSGDTPQEERRRMFRHPPEILITTPESLNLLLMSAGGRDMLSSPRTVIMDEVHAIVGEKRGIHLISAVERLVPLAGEFQRLALSATLRPLDEVAAWVGGRRLEAPERYVPREVTCIESPSTRRYEIAVIAPFEEMERLSAEGSIWPAIVDKLRERLARHRSTLIFARTRRLCEQLTQLLNQGCDEPIAYAHHGALSREMRMEVEQRMKAGRLKAIVATNSLELGIDIGTLDEVVMVQAPSGIAAAVQRTGRSGHRVGEVSRGLLIATHGQDLVACATLAAAIRTGDIEPIVPISGTLDVLAQIIAAMVVVEPWPIESLFHEVRRAWPYRHLTRRQFDLVLNMLAGRYAQRRLRELQARIVIDALAGTVTARKGTRLALYSGGGTIPDRGYFHLRHQESGALLGELDEEYVWESRVGEVLSFGNRRWRIEQITHNDVLVRPASAGEAEAPFWRGESINRDAHFSRLLAELLEEIEVRREDPRLAMELRARTGLDEWTVGHLLGYLDHQRERTQAALPHRHHLLVEHVRSGPGGVAGAYQVVLHTLWGGTVNYPYALALQAAWQEHFGESIEVFAGDDCIYLICEREVEGAEVMALVEAERIEPLLRESLEGSGYFGARFREAAGRALLITRQRLKERLPLWVSRLRAQRLLASVRDLEDFPLTLEAWRTCLRDEFDLPTLRARLDELRTGAIAWSEVRRLTPSPFARTMAWRQINAYMYEDDQPRAGGGTRLSEELLQEAVFTPELRPRVPASIVTDYVAKRQRLAPGYAPDTPEDLLGWLQERGPVPAEEWETLLAEATPELLAAIEPKLIRLEKPGGRGSLIAAREDEARLCRALWGEDDEWLLALLAEWLTYCGPVSREWLGETLGVAKERLDGALMDLVDTERMIEGPLVIGRDEPLCCDSDSFEILLRLARAEARPEVQAKPLTHLALFLAERQGLVPRGSGIDHVADCLEILTGWVTAPADWEGEYLPARCEEYDPAWLDSLLQTGGLLWMGRGKQLITFANPADVELIAERSRRLPEELARLFPDAGGRYTFSRLAQESDMAPGALTELLWRGVWQGHVANDSAQLLRQGIASRFSTPTASVPVEPQRRAHRPSHRRRGFDQWRQSLPGSGAWYLLPNAPAEDDALAADERNRERVRILLDRYGVLFRELLEREGALFRWGSLFRTLRLMELAGEIVSGSFFEGIPGLQFMSHDGLRHFLRERSHQPVYWLNARDPASLCGLRLPALRGVLPRRVSGNWLVYRGAELLMTVARSGAAITFHAPIGGTAPEEVLGPLLHLLNRRFQPLTSITIETIDDLPAARSEVLPLLRELFDAVKDVERIVLYRRRER